MIRRSSPRTGPIWFAVDAALSGKLNPEAAAESLLSAIAAAFEEEKPGVKVKIDPLPARAFATMPSAAVPPESLGAALGVATPVIRSAEVRTL